MILANTRNPGIKTGSAMKKRASLGIISLMKQWMHVDCDAK